MTLPSRWRVGSDRPRRARGRGQSLVEFALVLPVLLIVLLFAVDFGRAFYSWVILQNAARIGANFAALNSEGWEGTGDPVLQAQYAALVSKDWATLGCDPPAVPVFTDAAADTSIAGETPDTKYDVGDTVRVTLTCPFRPATPIISGILGSSIKLVATSEFRIRSGSIAGLTFEAQIPKPSTVAPTPTPGPTATPTTVPCTVTAAFIGNPLTGSGGSLSVQFTNQSTASAGCTIVSWAWNFGDGQTSTLPSPSHLFVRTSPGNSSQKFDVSLTVTLASGGSDPEVKNNYITVSK
jgi:Flp pilus assembly protein TadG